MGKGGAAGGKSTARGGAGGDSAVNCNQVKLELTNASRIVAEPRRVEIEPKLLVAKKLELQEEAVVPGAVTQVEMCLKADPKKLGPGVGPILDYIAWRACPQGKVLGEISKECLGSGRWQESIEGIWRGDFLERFPTFANEGCGYSKPHFATRLPVCPRRLNVVSRA